MFRCPRDRTTRLSLLISLVSLLAPTSLIALTLPGRVHAQTPVFSWGNPKPQGNALHGVAFADAQIGFAVGVRGTSMRTTDGGVTWSDLTDFESFAADLRDLVVLGAGEILAVGDAPGLYRSTDGGSSWTPVPHPLDGPLNEISRSGSFLSAAGDDGRILRSTDDGATWEIVPGPSPTLDIIDQWWRSETDGTVIGPFLLRRTTDGGASWNTIPGVPENNFFPGDIRFLGDQDGWILVDFTTWRTTDGGASWFERHGPFGQSPIYQDEALVLSETERFVITEAEGAEIWHTADDGLTWTLLYQRQSTSGYTDITRLPDGTIAVVSTDGDLLRSTDDGATWTNFTTSPGDEARVRLSAIGFLPSGRGLCGGGGVWLESPDAGLTWHTLVGPPPVADPAAILFRDDEFGLVGGYGPTGLSRICRTTDGGASWTPVSLSPTYVGYVTGVDVIGDLAWTSVYGGQNIGGIWRSTDAGASWERSNNGVPASVRLDCIEFVDPSLGFVGGSFVSSGRIYRTTDGGQSWSPLPESPALGSVSGMRWFDSQIGVASGLGGVSRTTDGGSSWVQALSGNIPSMDMADASTGYACTFSSTVWRTTDGGVSWLPIELPWDGAAQHVVGRPDGFVLCGTASVILKATYADPTGVGGDDAAGGGDDAGGGDVATGPRDGSEDSTPGVVFGDLGAGVRVRARSALATGAPVVLEVDAGNATQPTAPLHGTVFDALGRRTAAPLVRAIAPARWEIVWDGRAADGRAAAPGAYFVSLERNGRRGTVKIVRVR